MPAAPGTGEGRVCGSVSRDGAWRERRAVGGAGRGLGARVWRPRCRRGLQLPRARGGRVLARSQTHHAAAPPDLARPRRARPLRPPTHARRVPRAPRAGPAPARGSAAPANGRPRTSRRGRAARPRRAAAAAGARRAPGAAPRAPRGGPRGARRRAARRHARDGRRARRAAAAAAATAAGAPQAAAAGGVDRCGGLLPDQVCGGVAGAAGLGRRAESPACAPHAARQR
jgi:hypothetical protein